MAYCPIADGMCESARCIFWRTNQNGCLVAKALETYVEKRNPKVNDLITNLPRFGKFND